MEYGLHKKSNLSHTNNICSKKNRLHSNARQKTDVLGLYKLSKHLQSIKKVIFLVNKSGEK